MKQSRLWFASILKKWALILSREQHTLIDQNPSGNDKNDQKADQASESAPVISALIDIAKTGFEKYDRAQEQQRHDIQSSHTVAIAALIVAAFSWAVTVLLWYEAHEANWLTQVAQRQTENTIADTDRAWAGISLVTINEFSIGHSVKVTVTLLNSGKSPAIRFSSVTYLGLIKTDRIGDAPPREDILNPSLSQTKVRNIGNITLFPSSTVTTDMTSS
jgi:hypothetical protein